MRFFFYCIIIFGIACAAARAEDYSSTNFIIRDPLVAPQGGAYSSSPTYGLYTSTGALVQGEATSTSFTAREGFLYYPEATTPVVSATGGDGQVALTWTAASADLAGAITEYEVGQATVSGGPYSFTSVGDVLLSTRTGLSAGTAYYFVVRALDAQSNHIATSAEATATTTGSAVTGGGGGGVALMPITGIQFYGWAYPMSQVIFLQDGQRAFSTVAGPDARFYARIADLSSGSYTFGIMSEDRAGNRSPMLTFPLEIRRGITTSIQGIFIAPSVAVDKKDVRRGGTVRILGQSAPDADIILRVNSKEEFIENAKADGSGAYAYALDTSRLELGGHAVKAKSARDGQVSPFGATAAFTVSAKAPAKKPEKKCEGLAGDLNGDCRVNIVDFSILAHWYRAPSPAARIDMNNDGVINLRDFSIMAFYWSG